MWFEQLTGFQEESPEQVRERLTLEGEQLVSRVSGRRMVCGRLETPSLAELRGRVGERGRRGAPNRLREWVGDVTDLHRDADNAGALFQVASQFNLLEMVSPRVTPEHGVDGYEFDRTQGPACAIAAGAGTIFRNYFAPVNGAVGQSAANQIDCLAELGDALGNQGERLWRMENGYALPSEEGLREIDERLAAADVVERDRLRGRLRIGIQWDTEVTLDDAGHRVTQAYCSALPVGYSRLDHSLWAGFAGLVLEAAYEATLCAAILNTRAGGKPTVYLTLLGGGAFGNETAWIINAIRHALSRHPNAGLDLVIVSYARPVPALAGLVDSFGGT